MGQYYYILSEKFPQPHDWLTQLSSTLEVMQEELDERTFPGESISQMRDHVL